MHEKTENGLWWELQHFGFLIYISVNSLLTIGKNFEFQFLANIFSALGFQKFFNFSQTNKNFHSQQKFN